MTAAQTAAKAVKPNSKTDNGTRRHAGEIADFINLASDMSSDEVADEIVAQTIRKTMGKLGQTNGPKTQQALAEFNSNLERAIEVFTLPANPSSSLPSLPTIHHPMSKV